MISIIPNAVSNFSNFAKLSFSSVDEGEALSSFGVDWGFDGEALDSVLSCQTLGLSIDDLFENKILTEYPELIKIDVDGIEHIILDGARSVLNNPACKSVLVEISESFTAQVEGAKLILEESGFALVEKTNSPTFNVGKFKDSYNQIWIKK